MLEKETITPWNIYNREPRGCLERNTYVYMFQISRKTYFKKFREKPLFLSQMTHQERGKSVKIKFNFTIIVYGYKVGWT